MKVFWITFLVIVAFEIFAPDYAALGYLLFCGFVIYKVRQIMDVANEIEREHKEVSSELLYYKNRALNLEAEIEDLRNELARLKKPGSVTIDMPIGWEKIKNKDRQN